MATQDVAPSVGSRVRQARRALGMTQLDFAEKVGRSESWVRGVEHGRLILDRHSVIDRVADTLSIDVAWLLGQPYEPASPSQDAGHTHVPALRSSIRRTSLILSGHPGMTSTITPRSISEVHRQVVHLTRLRQAADLPAVMTLLQPTMEILNSSLLASDGPDLDATYVHLVEVNHIARMVLNQLGHHDLAWTAVENAALAATRLGDELIQACSAWDRCGVLLHTGSLGETIAVAEAALDRLEYRLADPSATDLSLWGALSLRCAVAASRRQDSVGAWQYLEAAERAAERLGHNRNDFQTVFGPTNVQVHAVEIAVELNDPKIALRRGRQIDLRTLPSRERVVHHGIDMARAYGQASQDANAVHALNASAKLSPHYVANHPMARALTAQLLRRSEPTAIEAGLGPLGKSMNLP